MTQKHCIQLYFQFCTLCMRFVNHINHHQPTIWHMPVKKLDISHGHLIRSRSFSTVRTHLNLTLHFISSTAATPNPPPPPHLTLPLPFYTLNHCHAKSTPSNLNTSHPTLFIPPTSTTPSPPLHKSSHSSLTASTLPRSLAPYINELPSSFPQPMLLEKPGTLIQTCNQLPPTARLPASRDLISGGIPKLA